LGYKKQIGRNGMIEINTNDKGVHFLYWLASIKEYSGLDIARVVEKIHHYTELQDEFLNDRREDL